MDPLTLPRDLFAALVASLRAALPCEGVGYLAGPAGGPCTHWLPLANELASPTAFRTTPTGALAAHKAMRAAGVELLAVVHSHPTGEPTLSTRDLGREPVRRRGRVADSRVRRQRADGAGVAIDSRRGAGDRRRVDVVTYSESLLELTELKRMRTFWAVLACVGLGGPCHAADGPRLVVALPPGASAASGRLVVALAPKGRTPSFTDAESRGTVVIGQDVALAPDVSALVGANAVVFPADDTFRKLPAGTYTARAALLVNRDLLVFDAPGNWSAGARDVTLADGKPAVLTLDTLHAGAPPADTATHKFLALDSPKLTAFHKRSMKTRVGVVLPKDFDRDTTATYPLVVHIGGFGGRYTAARRITPDRRFVQVVLDGAGPFGDPYQVDSAVNGPYGDVLVTEVIPHLEKQFRGNGTRFTTGGSTGGWVALALQLFYPDAFNGCWAQCPDGVDFRAFQLADLSRDANMYANRWGFDRPAKRTLDGDTVYTVRHEVRLERVLGGGGRWELGGQQWASWNAVYGPRAADGSPVPLWDGVTGDINADVAKQWAKYDLRKHLENEWPTLGPKLAGGKVNVWVGDADDYFLNNAVHRFKAAAGELDSPKFDGVIEIAPRRGHESGWGRARVLDAMAARAANARGPGTGRAHP